MYYYCNAVITAPVDMLLKNNLVISEAVSKYSDQVPKTIITAFPVTIHIIYMFEKKCTAIISEL